MMRVTLFICFFILVSCDIDKWDLDRLDIANFENTYTQAQYEDQAYAGFYQNESGNYFTALLRDSVAWLIEISKEGEWVGESNLGRANTAPDILYLDGSAYAIVNRENGSRLLEIDGDGQVTRRVNNIIDFIGMNYNTVDSVIINGMDYDASLNEILLVGYVSTFGTRLTIVLGIDPIELRPIWLRTHVFDGVADAVHCLRNGKYAVSGIKNGTPFIYMDNRQGSAFQNQSRPDFINTDYFHVDGTDSTVVIHGAEANGSRVVVFNEELIEFTSRSIPVGNSLIRTSVTKEGEGELVVVGAGQDAIFLNQLERGTLLNDWCNQFWDIQGLNPLNLTKDQELGYVILSLTPEGYVHLIKTDEEGATRSSPYSNQCL
jgi:hypothetical protein